MSDAASRLNAALEGRYRIERELGEGGMATVYLADDLKHERKVALKVLKPELAAVVGAERFLAEIKTTANLQHPHILPLFDSGEADSFLFYVMPYVEGESLRDRLERDKQLPVDEAVRIVTDVAEALHSAHEQGVIHRDIKPANILMSKGRPLVADFGIALAVSAAGGGRLTETGLSMGTPYYMSPEQASADREPSAASDVYSLGCVLYEMLVGEPPYVGNSAQAVLAKILTEDARSATKARPSIPANVDAAIRKALEKLPADRFASASALAAALGHAGFRHGGTVEAATTTSGSAANGGPWIRDARSIAVTTLAVVMTLAAGWSLLRSSLNEPRGPLRLEASLPSAAQDQFFAGIALSPDGSQLAFVGTSPEDGLRLWQRPIDRLESVLISGTEGAYRPTFSPDGQAIAFVSSSPVGGASLKITSLQSGVTTTVAEPVAVSGFVQLDWGSDDMLYFNDLTGALNRVSAYGGEVEPLSIFGQGVDVLPDNGGLMTVVAGEVVVVSNDGAIVTPIVPALRARYSPSGHLIYVTADRTLMAAPFDAGRLQVTGPAVALAERVAVGGTRLAHFTLSKTGILAYYPDPDRVWEIVKVSRSGQVQVIHPGQPEPILSLALSPDESRIAVSVGAEENRTGASVPQNIWMKSVDGGQMTRLTRGSKNLRPKWHPDGRQLAFISDRGEGHGVWVMRADGVGEATPLQEQDEGPLYGIEWSSDGQWMLSQAGGAGARDVTGLRVGEDTEARVLLGGEADEFSPALSPDGRWLAYVSDESGGPEVFVRPFPSVDDGKWQVSQGGAFEPAWANGGTELFYRSVPSGDMMAVRVETESGFSSGTPVTLFAAADYHSSGAAVATYSVSRDDRSFYMIRPRAAAPQLGAIVLVNVDEEIRRLTPN